MKECWHFIHIATVKHGWRRVVRQVKVRTSGDELSAPHKRHSAVTALYTQVQAAKTLLISGYDMVSIADMENLTGVFQV